MANYIDFEEQSKKIKMIALEIDGVITEGLVCITDMPSVAFKQYNLKDFEAIDELKNTFKVVVVSSDWAVNKNLCASRHIPFFCMKTKKEALSKAMIKYGVTPEEVVYVGHSFSDIDNCRMIPFSLCPSDAVSDIKNCCHVLESFAGYGVMAEIYDLLKNEIIRRKKLDKS